MLRDGLCIPKDAMSWVGIVGFGLLWGWLYVCALETNDSQGGYAYMLLSSIVEVVVFSLPLVLPTRLVDRVLGKARFILISATLCASAVTMIFFAPGIADSKPLRIVFAIAQGAGFSFFAIAWGLSFARRFERGGLQGAVMLSALVMVAVRMPFAFALTEAGVMLASVALPLSSCVLYAVFTSKEPDEGACGDKAVLRVVPGVKARHLVNLFTVAMPLTLLFGALPPEQVQMFGAIFAALVLFAVFAVACLVASAFGLRTIHVPLITSMLLLVAGSVAFALGPVAYDASASLTCLGVFIYDTGIWVFSMMFASARGVRGIRNFCAIKAVFSFSHVAAYVLVIAALELKLDPSQYGVILLAILAGCLVANRFCVSDPIGADLGETVSDASESPLETAVSAMPRSGETPPPCDAASCGGACHPATPVHEGAGPKTFEGKCEELSREGGLTKRESEIMVLLARGHNRAHVKEALYLAEGTLNTHTMSIYRKLNVHSQQELINMVDKGHPLS